ncbi:MAG: substrate-binding domain-containing protein [Planctomycetota bacterium]|nr:substrate-binding domain-containing protein [Planctomycetota bacterium]
MKKLLVAALVVLAAFAAPACAEERPTETYGMVVFLKGSEFFNWAYAGMIDAAAAIGPHVKTELHGPAEWDATLEARAIEQLVAKKIDGVIVTAGEANTLVPAINRAIRAKIPVITFDSDAPASNRLCFVGTNNYQAGYEAGKAMGEWLGNDARIGICTFPGPDHLKNRQDGFEAGLKEVAPGAQIVAVVNDEGDVAKAETQLTAMLQANKEINGIFGAHGNPGPGAAAAVRSLGLQGKVQIMAFDFGLPVIELIEKGEIKGTVGQNPYLMGYQAMMLAYAAHHPTEIPSMFEGFGHVPVAGIDTGVRILDKDTSAMYKNPPRF